jgi:hypothetical protein
LGQMLVHYTYSVNAIIIYVRLIALSSCLCSIVLYCDIVLNFYVIVLCIVGGCDKFHIQRSLPDIGSMKCVYVNVNVALTSVPLRNQDIPRAEGQPVSFEQH